MSKKEKCVLYFEKSQLPPIKQFAVDDNQIPRYIYTNLLLFYMQNKSNVMFLKTYYKRNNKLFKEDLDKFYDEFLMTAEGGVEICLALEFAVWYENFNSNKDSMISLVIETYSVEDLK